MYQTYTVTIDGCETMRFDADLAQAAAPVSLHGQTGLVGTPFQTADGRHIKSELARKLNRWCRSEGGEAWADIDDARIVVIEAEPDQCGQTDD